MRGRYGVGHVGHLLASPLPRVSYIFPEVYIQMTYEADLRVYNERALVCCIYT